jgi:hypothetical protein
MARRKLTDSQIVCLTLLWGVLAYMLLSYSKVIDFSVNFYTYCFCNHCVCAHL